jgi:hypothetical protein
MAKRRRYNLTPEGRAMLRASARAIPAGSHTGPRTEAGKSRSRFNSLKSGQHGRLGGLAKRARGLARRIAAEADPTRRAALEARLAAVMAARRAWIAAIRAAGFEVRRGRVVGRRRADLAPSADLS